MISKIEIFKPNYIQVRVNHNEPVQVNLLQVDYPGWEVKVDGKEVKHFDLDEMVISIMLSKGNHTVEFHFKPKSFSLILIISAISFSLVIMILYAKQIHFAFHVLYNYSKNLYTNLLARINIKD